MAIYDVQYSPDAENTCWTKAVALTKKDAVVLDVGCSKGAFGEALAADRNAIVDGIEPDTGDAAVAGKKLRTVYSSSVEETVEKIKSTPVRYDHITFMDVIEHIVNPVEVLQSLKPVLKKDGSIIFSIPNMAHVSVRLQLLKGDFEYGESGLLDNTHLHYYTESEIRRVFQDAGYDITLMDYTEAKYPKQLIKQSLADMGLTANKKGLELLMDRSAGIFQYVGEAKPSTTKKKKAKRVVYSPDAQGEITRHHQAHIQQLESENKRLEADLATAQQDYANITSSKAYRAARKIANTTRSLRK